MYVPQVLVVLLVLLNSVDKSSQNVTEGQFKESDIIKITVEKKETTKTIGQSKAHNSTKVPLTILPPSHLKTKPARQTAAPANMVTFDKSKGSNKFPEGNQRRPTDAPMSIEDYKETLPVEMTTEITNDIDFQVHGDLDQNFDPKTTEYGFEASEQAQGEFADRNLPIIENSNSTWPEDNTEVTDGLLGNSSTEIDMTTVEARNETAGLVVEDNQDEMMDFGRNETASTESMIFNHSQSHDQSEETTTEGGDEGENGFSKVCGHSGNGRLQYVWGDAFEDTDCLGPNMQRYPSEVVNRMFEDKWKKLRHKRETRDPTFTRDQLLRGWLNANGNYITNNRMMKSSLDNEIRDKTRCPGQTKKLCKSDYNTTAPIFGMSMTTGQPVAIVQKFPDLLQQVIYEVCLSDECAVVHGKCINTYIPYLFLTIPLGPVTLTGQDYILVESGCSCKPDP